MFIVYYIVYFVLSYFSCVLVADCLPTFLSYQNKYTHIHIRFNLTRLSDNKYYRHRPPFLSRLGTGTASGRVKGHCLLPLSMKHSEAWHTIEVKVLIGWIG